MVSRPLLDEFTRVAARPAFAKRLATWTAEAAALAARLERRATLVEIAGVSYGCRDPKDDAVIETALRGRVQYLVTGDQDLLDAHVAVTLNAHGILLTTARTLVAKLAQ